MRETENYCKQTREIKSGIKKLYSVVDCSKFLVRAVHNAERLLYFLLRQLTLNISRKQVQQQSCLSKSKFDLLKVQVSKFKVCNSKPLIVNSFGVCDFIDLILSFPILTLLVCHSFFIDYLRNSRIGVFISDTHYFLASHSASSSLPRQSFLLMMSSNCQLFYLS